VNHGFSGGSVGAFRGARGGGEEKIYIKLAKKERMQTFGRGDEIKFLDFMITIKCGVDFGIGL